jgi:hypothetical protein
MPAEGQGVFQSTDPKADLPDQAAHTSDNTVDRSGELDAKATGF